MRALIYSDLQATDGHERMFGDPTKSLQIWRVEKFYEDLLKIYQENECDTLWDLGDTTDDRTAIPMPAIDTVCYGLSRFPRNDYDVKLVGNHEQYLRNTKVNIGAMFAPYFTVIEKPMSFEVNGVTVMCVPYPADEAEMEYWVASQRSKYPTILLGHFQISGCWGSSGMLLSGLTLEKLGWIRLGLLGHIHKPQQLGNCHYVGSPFQQDWGEAGDEKRVGIVDISDRGEINLSWVPLSGYPEYREVSLTEFEEACSGESEDRFRVVLKSMEDATKFYASRFAHRAEPQYDFDVSKVVKEGQEEIRGVAWTPESVMSRYLDKNPPGDRGIPISREEMLQFGLDIYAS